MRVTGSCHHLLDTALSISTDHGALTWLQKFGEPDRQKVPWIQKL